MYARIPTWWDTGRAVERGTVGERIDVRRREGGRARWEEEKIEWQNRDKKKKIPRKIKLDRRNNKREWVKRERGRERW